MAKSEPIISTEEKKEGKKKGKKRSKISSDKATVLSPQNDSNSATIIPLTGATQSPQKSRVQTNVYRNVGNERKSSSVKPVHSAKKSPQKSRVQTNVHRNVGNERKSSSVKPVHSAKKSPQKSRVQTNIHRGYPSATDGQRQRVVSQPPTKKERDPIVVDKSMYTPRGWNPEYHRIEIPSEYSSIDPRRWGAGVFHYNPPRSQSARVVERYQGSRTGKSHQPRREINRRQQLSVGGRGTVYGSGYVDGGEYVDAGVGLAVGYRFFEALGAELSYHYFSEHLGESDSDRTNVPIQAVGQLHLFPWTKVSPFVSAGYAWNQIDVHDHYQVNGESKQALQAGILTGPVVGAGVEFSLSKHLALSAEGRYLMYQNLRFDDPAKDNGVTLTSGLNLYF